MSKPTVGVIGLGLMGGNIGRRLIEMGPRPVDTRQPAPAAIASVPSFGQSAFELGSGHGLSTHPETTSQRRLE